jgi:hypothetical protein
MVFLRELYVFFFQQCNLVLYFDLNQGTPMNFSKFFVAMEGNCFHLVQGSSFGVVLEASYVIVTSQSPSHFAKQSFGSSSPQSLSPYCVGMHAVSYRSSSAESKNVG